MLSSPIYTALPGVNMPSLLTSWVASSPYIAVASTQLQVDTTCPVVIDSLEPESCPAASTAPPTDPPTNVTVVAVAVCVIITLVVVTIIVAIVIAVILFCRKQQKYRYVQLPTTPLSYMTVSNWITAQVISLWWYHLQYCAHYFPMQAQSPSPQTGV